MKICITGGGNVYALNFARHLASIGIDHFGIGRTGPKAEPFWQVTHDYNFYQFHLIRDFHEVMVTITSERPDVIVNFAAQGEGAASFDYDSHLFYATNCSALVKFAEAARGYGVKRFIQIGTSELYGSVDRAMKETDALNPSSPYAISKAAFDQHLQVLHRIHGFPMNVIRPSNCYCPGQQLHRVIPQAIIAALSKRRMKLQGGGQSRKSYLHATDLSRAIVGVIQNGTTGKIYNCGPDEPIRIRGLVDSVAIACGAALNDIADIAPQRTGEDGCYWLDSSALKRDTGWSSTIGLPEGLHGMVEWVKRYPELITMDSTYRITP